MPWQPNLATHHQSRGLATLFTLAARTAQTTPAPLSYDCYRTETPIRIDGKLDDPAWQKAPWTADFVDIEGAAKPTPRFRTRAKMLWDDNYLYIAAELEEPHVTATLTKHDSVIFHDNDFEVFLKPLADDRELLRVRDQRAQHRLGSLPATSPTAKAARPTTAGTSPD